jgi:hypothetical protein
VRVCYLEPELVASKPTSVGRAIPGTEVFVLDHEGYTQSRAARTGASHVRGPSADLLDDAVSSAAAESAAGPG